jgi:aminomethyltransferase
MGQIVIEASAEALEALVPSDLAGLPAYRQRYSVLTNESGGIIDDLMIIRLPGSWLAVVNAAFKESDLAHLCAGLGGNGTARLATDRALLALQGPAAASVLTEHCRDAASLPFMAAQSAAVAGIECLVTRCGYTGEDGFELACDANDAERLARLLLLDERVAAIGLGARDTLRLEAGLCLSGTDIDATTSVVAAGLGFTVAKKYRGNTPAAVAFPGSDTVLRELRTGTPRVRVGLRPVGRIPLHGGTAVHDADGRAVGRVTSGSFGPTLGHPVAMAYLDRDLALTGTLLSVTIRGRQHAVEVAALPFVAHRYKS